MDRGDSDEALHEAWEALASGDSGATARLMPILYERLRTLAAAHLAGERTDHTLQATALVHEAWCRLSSGSGPLPPRDAFIAAAAFVKAEMKIPPGVLVAGVPAKVLRELTEQERKWKVIGTDCYQNLARRSLASLKPCEPLREGDRERARFEMPDVMPLSDARRRAG